MDQVSAVSQCFGPRRREGPVDKEHRPPVAGWWGTGLRAEDLVPVPRTQPPLGPGGQSSVSHGPAPVSGAVYL